MTIVKLEVTPEPDDEGRGANAPQMLKERSATALEGAYRFLEAEADADTCVRARTLMGVDPVGSLVSAIASSQTDEGALGGQGLWAGGCSGPGDLQGIRLPDALAGTLEALMVLSDLSSLHAACVEPAALFLQTVQADDGGFGPPDLPDASRVFATGMLAGLLGRTRVVRPALLDGAGEFLGPRFSPDAVEGGGWASVTAFGTFFSNVSHDRSDEALQWCGRELERGFRSRRFDAAATVRALLFCDALALPGAQLDPIDLLEGLLTEQAGDGGFAELSFQGVGARITPTVDAIFAIVSLCQRF